MSRTLAFEGAVPTFRWTALTKRLRQDGAIAMCHPADYRALPYRLASLKEVIIPGRDKEDQAGFLVSSASYIRQLQV